MKKCCFISSWGIVVKFFLALVMGVLLVIVFLSIPYSLSKKQSYGVSFSVKQAVGLGLSWQGVYGAAIDDLGVRRLRLNAYWDEIELLDDKFDFSDLDYQMDAAADAGAKVVLAVGRKLPRWPECHEPKWLIGKSAEEKQQEVLEMIEVVGRRYASHEALVMWQLENEPFFDFGLCTVTEGNLLKQEENVLRSVGGGYPIMVTDSGELSLWLKAAHYGDVFGTTMYRSVYSQEKSKRISYDYKFPAWMYRVKANLVGIFERKGVIISELQGEPWFGEPFNVVSKEERLKYFPPERLNAIRDFAQRTRFKEAYWWGVEYWYWEKEQGDERYWDIAKTFFRE